MFFYNLQKSLIFGTWKQNRIMHSKAMEECRNHSENLINRKRTIFCIEYIPQHFSQLRKKNRHRKKIPKKVFRPEIVSVSSTLVMVRSQVGFSPLFLKYLGVVVLQHKLKEKWMTGYTGLPQTFADNLVSKEMLTWKDQIEPNKTN